MLAVWKYFGLQGQKSTTRINKIDARQPVFACHFLGTQVLLDCKGKVGAALHGGVIGNDHHLATVHDADTGDHTGTRSGAVVHAVGRQWGEFQKRGTGIEEGINAVPRQQFAALPLQGNGALAAAFARLSQGLTQAFGLLQIV